MTIVRAAVEGCGIGQVLLRVPGRLTRENPSCAKRVGTQVLPLDATSASALANDGRGSLLLTLTSAKRGAAASVYVAPAGLSWSHSACVNTAPLPQVAE